MGGFVWRALRRPEVISLGLPILALLVSLAIAPGRVHPQLSRQAVINTALAGYKAGEFPRVEAKLMYRRDLQRADPQ